MIGQAEVVVSAEIYQFALRILGNDPNPAGLGAIDDSLALVQTLRLDLRKKLAYPVLLKSPPWCPHLRYRNLDDHDDPISPRSTRNMPSKWLGSCGLRSAAWRGRSQRRDSQNRNAPARCIAGSSKCSAGVSARTLS